MKIESIFLIGIAGLAAWTLLKNHQPAGLDMGSSGSGGTTTSGSTNSASLFHTIASLPQSQQFNPQNVLAMPIDTKNLVHINIPATTNPSNPYAVLPFM